MSAILVHQNLSTASPQPSSSPSAAALAFLRREAAQFGPGLFGVRRDGSDAERLALARRFAVLGEPTPVYVLSRARWTDRGVRLLEAGIPHDRALDIAPHHLIELVRRFDAPVPILSEKSGFPSGFGYVTAVEERDAALYGTITLSAEAEAFLLKVGEVSLSVRPAPDLSRLVEVSLAHGIESDARLFSFAPSFLTVLKALPAANEPNRAEAEEAAAVLLLPEEAEFYRRHAPASALGEVLSRRF